MAKMTNEWIYCRPFLRKTLVSGERSIPTEPLLKKLDDAGAWTYRRPDEDEAAATESAEIW